LCRGVPVASSLFFSIHRGMKQPQILKLSRSQRINNDISGQMKKDRVNFKFYSMFIAREKLKSKMINL
jgi:hypothetical protein